ncbi:hypothetical protein BOX15_Mlig026560g4, partial [Macrostomum lignano]
KPPAAMRIRVYRSARNALLIAVGLAVVYLFVRGISRSDYPSPDSANERRADGAVIADTGAAKKLGQGDDHRRDPVANNPPANPVAPSRQAALVVSSDHDEFVEAPPADSADGGDALQLVDWHDHKAIAKEKQRKGPGEQGLAYNLPADQDKAEVDRLYRANGYNGYLSDRLSLYRSIKDLRHPQCLTQKYRRKLPTAAIVIPFHNEHFSTLLRTVVSCRHRAPRELLKEIILVDDNSSKPELKTPLDDYLKAHFDNVFVVRAKRREGLIRARLLGAERVTADTFIVLDSHCECGINWLPPLLDPIAENWRTAVCPFVDIIDFDNYEIRPQDEGARGSWDWQFFYKRLPLLPEDRLHPARPFASPVMAGGLFAISTKFFRELGGYDPGLDIWGGEQYELSFKIWQCHGRMLDAPCSRVAHIYRKFAPFPNPGIGDFLGRNFKRVAEVWMDEYKEYLYKRKQPYYSNVQTGNITAQKEIRRRLKCKSFRWFMEKVAFDQPKHFPLVEPAPAASGEVKNVGNGLCLDTKFRGEHAKIEVDKCLGDGGQGEQRLVLTYRKDIRPDKKDVCFDVPNNADRAPVILFGCHGFQGNQWWKLIVNTGQLKHPVTDKCLDSDKATREVFVSYCDPAKDTQRWKWQFVNATLANGDAALPDGELRMN